jgi:hypothetical protein
MLCLAIIVVSCFVSSLIPSMSISKRSLSTILGQE